MPIYQRPTRELFEEFVQSFVPPPSQGLGLIERKSLSKGGNFTRKEILTWFQENYPKIKQATVNAHLTRMAINAPSRIHHSLRPNGADDLLFQISRSIFRLYNADSDPSPIYRESEEESTAEDTDNFEEEQDEKHEFAYEKDLKNFLARNLHVIRPSMVVYEDGDIRGVEYPVGGRFIDILAVENEEELVVIELKVSKGYDRALGQLLRYMAWIKKNLAETNQKVKGMIVARTVSEDLRLAVSIVDDVELFEYQLSISLNQIDA